jgi:hypothetical protein
MITVRCKECGKELTSTSKVQFCGCPNQMRVVDNKVGAVDLDKVVMVSKRRDADAKFVDWTLKSNKEEWSSGLWHWS